MDRRCGLAEGYNTGVGASGRLAGFTGRPLAADPRRQEAFDGLPFTHQREYAEWVAEAKREATRRRRLEQTVQMLRDGRRHP